MTTGKKRLQVHLLIALSCLLYFTSYMTRLDFNAVLADMIATTPLTKSQGGMIGTALFITYGLGQIVIGFLGDRIRPNLIIMCGLTVTAVCNAVFPLCDHIAFYISIWGLNGFAQAMFWPPLIRILADRFDKRDYSTALVWICAAANAATVLLYLIVPLFIVTLGWESVFFFMAGFSAIVIPIWGLGITKLTADNAAPADTAADTESERQANDTDKSDNTERKKLSAKDFWKVLLCCNMPCIFIAIALHGFLKDGITTWMPTYLDETFGLGTSVSILVNIALPIFGIIAVALAAVLMIKLFRNEMTASAAYFAVSAATLLLLFFFADKHASLSIILSAMTVGCMHGINLMLVSDVPALFVKYGKISTVSGLTNASTYIGSALSSYLIALLAEKIGWQYSILMWFAIAAVGTLLCCVMIKRWKRFTDET